MTSSEYVVGRRLDIVPTGDVRMGGQPIMTPTQVGPLHAVPAGTADGDGMAASVCGKRVQLSGGEWPPEGQGDVRMCDECRDRTV